MAQPTERNKDIEDMLEATTGMISAVKNDTCWHCRGEATEFKDELSRREYVISGMCQECQNEFFG